MSFVFFAWLANIFYATEVIAAKLTSSNSIRNPWLFNFLWGSILTAFIIAISLLNHAGMPHSFEFPLLSGFCEFLYLTLFILAIYKIDVSTISPLYNFRAAFSAILGLLFASEILTSFQFFLVIIIFFAGFFVSMDEKLKLHSFFKKEIALALFAMVSLASSGLFIKFAIREDGYWTATLWIAIFAQLFLFTTLPKFGKELLKVKKKQFFSVMIAALATVGGNLASNKAFSENVGISSIIISIPLSMIFAFVLSFFAPKLLEKHTLKVYAIRFTAATIMILAALRLSM